MDTQRADIAIIGAGPAGVSAALTAKARNLDVVLFGNEGISAKVRKAHGIRNYPGLPDVSGEQLASAFQGHLDAMGVGLVQERVVGVYGMGDAYSIQTSTDAFYEATAVIVATGLVQARSLPGEDELLGKGVSYCATCDAFFFRGKEVAVLGAGTYALHEAGVLLPLAKRVTLLTNGDPAPEELPQDLDLDTRPIAALVGESGILSAVRFADGGALEVCRLFVALGTAGSGDLARKVGLLTENGKIVVDGTMATNVPGLFAAGDCTGGLPQVATAVAQGAQAGLSAVRYLQNR